MEKNERPYKWELLVVTPTEARQDEALRKSSEVSHRLSLNKLVFLCTERRRGEIYRVWVGAKARRGGREEWIKWSLPDNNKE
ncbi:hypothetical protein CEXT_601081 [Caerostris extrusa]|uniref:Uncharacterized protein n=1 Tax=Caerostris extrusa TaxID=172846 RepID=A0AAV4QRS1_CAEEX|nr:hypothetical protein CEXT_601081 [Caerostris extrusa]